MTIARLYPGEMHRASFLVCMALVRAGRMGLPYRYDRKRQALSRERREMQEKENAAKRFQKCCREFNYRMRDTYGDDWEKVATKEQEAAAFRAIARQFGVDVPECYSE